MKHSSSISNTQLAEVGGANPTAVVCRTLFDIHNLAAIVEL
jgi:hypothetical protein